MPGVKFGGGAATQPKLITVPQAAELLSVSSQTVRNWIDKQLIPFIVLPHEPEASRVEHRIPLQGLLACLGGTYDLAADLNLGAELRLANEAASSAPSVSGDDVLAALHRE
jgi:Helix-turn-helix domain